MRLSDFEIKVIKGAVAKYITKPKIILFGSRVDDNKKGGDIDLLIISEESVNLEKQIKILSEMEYNGIQRKVDLLVKKTDMKKEGIFKTAMEEGIEL